MRRIAVLLLSLFATTAIACQSPPPPSPTPTVVPAKAPASTKQGAAVAKQYSAPPAMQIDPNKQYRAVIRTTEGDMTADLFAKDAPKTVNNFVFLAREGFYNNVPFHRIIKGFMVQTGDPTGTGRGGPGYRFEDEPVKREYKRGTLAMANAGPNTNGSQFFIIHQDYPLPKDYTIFGQVVEGLDILDKIANTPVQMGAGGDRVPSVPAKDVRITGVEISEK